MNRFNRQVADERIELLEVPCLIGNPAFVLALIQVLCGGYPKCAFRSYTKDSRLSYLLYFLREVFFRLCEFTFSSAFANASASDYL
jgi:hypothetical protein